MDTIASIMGKEWGHSNKFRHYHQTNYHQRNYHQRNNLDKVQNYHQRNAEDFLWTRTFGFDLEPHFKF